MNGSLLLADKIGNDLASSEKIYSFFLVRSLM